MDEKSVIDTGAALVLAQTDLSRPLTVIETQAQINVIQQLMRNNMREGTHYGIVPGAKKPSLWKPGAELIASVFHIATDPHIDDLSLGSDLFRYRVRVTATRQSDGIFLGAAYGECASNESKYLWRAAVCNEEFETWPVDQKRLHYKSVVKSREGFVVVKQIRTHAPDLANTVLKMAHKRGLVAVILVVTAASDIFTQDVEEMPDELRGTITEEDREGATDTTATPVAEPKKTSETKAAAPPTGGERLTVTTYRVAIEKPDWSLFKFTLSDGVERSTFSREVFDVAKRACEADPRPAVAFEGKQGPKGYEVTKLEVLP